MAGLDERAGGDGDDGGRLVRHQKRHKNQNGPAGAHVLKGNYNAGRSVLAALYDRFRMYGDNVPIHQETTATLTWRRRFSTQKDSIRRVGCPL